MSTLFLLMGAALFAPQASPVDGGNGTDWPEFLGPERSGRAPEVTVDFDWSNKAPKVLWRTELGPGYGGPAVRDGEVFLLDHALGEGDTLRVLDLESGELLWDLAYEAAGRLMFPGSRTVPTVTETEVFTAGGLGHVTCFDRASKSIRWSVNLTEDYGGEMPMFGWSASPLLVGEHVIVAPLGPEVGLVALDRASGEEVWASESLGTSHSTPTLLTLLGRPQVVMLSTTYPASGQEEAAPTTISSFDPEDGTPLWSTETMLSRLPIPGPVQIDDERFFVTGGYRSGSTLMKIARDEEGYSFEELFHIERGSQVHTPILHGEHLYLIVNENWNHQPRSRQKEGGLMCLDLSGKELWRTADAPFFGRGNTVLVSGHLVIQDGDTGLLRAVRPTPEGYKQVGEANPFELEGGRDLQMWAPIAVAGTRLLLRSQDAMVCVQL